MDLPALQDPEVDKGLRHAGEVLAGAGRIAIACHVGPDGDALGSMLGLGLSMRALGKQVVCGWGAGSVDVPGQYAFLPGQELLVSCGKFPDDVDCFVALDCASADRLDLLLEAFNAAPVSINVDHHVSNTRFGSVDVIDAEAPSTSELVLRLLGTMQAPVDAAVATCLYTGLLTDTGRFQYASVTPRAHAAAGRLIDHGVRVDEVSQAVFESLPYGYLKALGRVLDRCRIYDDPPLVVSYMRRADLAATNVRLDETEGIIDVVRSTRESDVAAVVKEMHDGAWKVSLRSKGATDVAAIASRLGGGGHRLAAGYTSREDLDQTIATLRSELRAAQAR